MTYAISVPTPFSDISELAESFHSRVDEERIMLPNPDAIPEGEWVQFDVTLADGSAALQGQGRCTGSYDNGEERAPEHRFDVVMDSLQLDEMAQIYFDRILQVRAAHAGMEAATGEVDAPAQDASPAESQTSYADQTADPSTDEAAYTEGAVYDEVTPGADAGEPAPELADSEAVTPQSREESGEYVEATSGEYAEVAAQEYVDASPAEYADASGHPSADASTAASAHAASYAAEPAASFDDASAEMVSADEVSFEDMSLADEPSVDLASGSGAIPLDSAEMLMEAPSLQTPAESKIYELPPPEAPAALPSPHGAEEVLTRPVLHASWSPEPMPRDEPGPSSGHFLYAMDAGLPQPAEPPRPDLDPSFRVQPAPKPGDPHAGAAFARQYEEQPYGQAEPADQAYDASESHGAYSAQAGPAVGYAEAAYVDEEASYGEGAYRQAGYAEEPGYDGEEGYVDDAALEVGAYGHAQMSEEPGQMDIAGLPNELDLGEETRPAEAPEEG